MNKINKKTALLGISKLGVWIFKENQILKEAVYGLSKRATYFRH